jgi:hypothetical protein
VWALSLHSLQGIEMKNRATLIQQLVESMNTRYTSTLTFEQVEHWVGSDANNDTINDYIDEVRAGDDTAVTPDDVTSLWLESQ